MLPPTPTRGLWLETSRTEFHDNSNLAATTVFLGGRYPVAPGVTVRFDFPVARARTSLADLSGEFINGTALGNPYLGVEVSASDRLSLSVGGRLPLAEADDEEDLAGFVAMSADPLRAEAFWPDVVPVSTSLNFTEQLSSILSLRARAGGTGLFFQDRLEEDGDDFEATLDYGVGGTLTHGKGRFNAGLAGRLPITEDGEQATHQLGFSADVAVGGVRPGVSLRVPLDDHWVEESAGLSLGLYLQVPLR